MFWKTQQEQMHLATCPIEKSLGKPFRALEELEVAIWKSNGKPIRALQKTQAEF